MARKPRNFIASDSTIHLLHRAGQLADEAFLSALGRDGITARQFIVMAIVAREDNPSQTMICEQSGIDRSTLADIVRRLVAKGLLQRKRTRRDARMYAVRLTDKGNAILKSAEPAAKSTDERVLSALSQSQRDGFLEALKRIIDVLDVSNANRIGR